MSFTDQYALANDPVFQSRVTMAVTKSAIAILNEDVTTVGHAERTAYAVQALTHPEIEGMNQALGCTTNAAITAESLDSDIEFQVNAQWNAYAGVGAGPVTHGPTV